MSVFEHVRLAPADPILGLTEAFKADERTSKVNLGIGVYLDENGQLPLMECVHVAEDRLAAAAKPHAYLPIDGLPGYVRLVRELAFGADFIATLSPGAPVLISDPSWENHRAIFARAGFSVGAYRYYDAEARAINFEGMIADLEAARPGTVVVLHACCHNPTGYDLCPEQWGRVIRVIADRGMIPFLDMAYQGFGAGVTEDGAVISRFVEAGLPVFVSTSFSKSFGLYGERVGALHVACRDAEEATRVLSQVKICIRTNYSNPSTHGAAIVADVLGDPTQRASWERELGRVRDRIKRMRIRLVEALRAEGVENMDFIAQQVGMFSYSGLTRDQMLALRRDHGIYGTEKGRMCVAALNDGNLEAVAKAIAAVRVRAR